MNQMLDKAMKAAATLPDSEQNELAEGVLEFVALVRLGGPLLTPEQQAGVERAMREAREGDFAIDDDMARIWQKYAL